jgi:hypothetical protein
MLKKFVYIFVLLNLHYLAFSGNEGKEKSATKTISGKVTNAYGETLPGTKITVKETGETFFADFDGAFKLSLNADKVYSLSIETIGYQPLELKSSQISLFSELSLKSL